MSHALGIFTATVLFAIAALAGIDRGGKDYIQVQVGSLLTPPLGRLKVQAHTADVNSS